MSIFAFVYSSSMKLWMGKILNSLGQRSVLPLFSCPGSSLPDLGQWLTKSLTATFEFWHNGWLLTHETLQTFDGRQKDKNDKNNKQGQKDKKWQKGQKDKEMKRRRAKETNRQKEEKGKETKIKKEFIIVMSGQFRTLAMFFLLPISEIYLCNPVFGRLLPIVFKIW